MQQKLAMTVLKNERSNLSTVLGAVRELEMAQRCVFVCYRVSLNVLQLPNLQMSLFAYMPQFLADLKFWLLSNR